MHVFYMWYLIIIIVSSSNIWLYVSIWQIKTNMCTKDIKVYLKKISLHEFVYVIFEI